MLRVWKLGRMWKCRTPFEMNENELWVRTTYNEEIENSREKQTRISSVKAW